MAGVDFTREDVIEESGVDPWELADDFAEEVDPEEMAEASRGFAAAAGEAGSAGELAVRASELSQDAAMTDEVAHHNAEEHITITDQDLQGSGQDIQDVADIINSATELALETWESVADRRSDAVGKVHEHLTDARTMYNVKFGELKEQADAEVVMDNPTVYFQGTAYEADGSRQMGWSMPSHLVTAIREEYLGKAVEDVTAIHERMDTEIDEYRSWMMARAGELSDLGYDLGTGPHTMWHTEDMAEWAAEGIEEELAKDEPDHTALENYTAGLAAISNGIYDPNDPTTPLRDLEPGELDYLEAFYNNIDEETLAKLGELQPDPRGSLDAAAASAERLAAIQANVANGINIMLNSDIGGIDIDVDDPASVVPESVRAYVYEAADDLGAAGGLESQREVLDRFNGFGALMEQATVPPSGDFADHLTTAAIDVQHETQEINRRAYLAARGEELEYNSGFVMPDFLENTGSSGLLTNVAQNTEASFDLLNDEGVREDLLNAQWADSDGVGDLVRSAVLPQGDANDDARNALADEVIQHFLGENRKLLIEDWDNSGLHGGQGRYPWDPTGLQGAIADATVSRLDAIIDLKNGEFPGVWSTADRHEVFSLMAASDGSVYQDFKAGVFEMQRNLAWEYYSSPPGEVLPGDVPETFQNIGILNGLLNWGEQDVINWYGGRADAAAALEHKFTTAGIGAAFSLAGTFSPEKYATGVSLSSTAYSLAESTLFPAPSPQEPLDQEIFEMTEGEINNMMAHRAIAAGAIDAHNQNLEPGAELMEVISGGEIVTDWSGHGSTPTALNRAADGVKLDAAYEAVYGGNLMVENEVSGYDFEETKSLSYRNRHGS
ncbi:hypothetical protein [Streptomyces sp. NBRC 109706]|uniref:hypothetical protein n=1 Tax=Streptomyces sp. NBRC 109706 TaxID=1550035 RepID=UPI00078246B9|nr:hypothetical protein [Streptomyces sp. NBRC 109706]